MRVSHANRLLNVSFEQMINGSFEEENVLSPHPVCLMPSACFWSRNKLISGEAAGMWGFQRKVPLSMDRDNS